MWVRLGVIEARIAGDGVHQCGKASEIKSVESRTVSPGDSMTVENTLAQRIAVVVGSERRVLFPALLAVEISIAGRLNYPEVSEIDDATRSATPPPAC
jgi:hypothetical protein